MSRRLTTRAGAAILMLCVLTFSGCAGSSFGRDEAISALYSAGATAAEASCIADTLVALDEIDALDPRLGSSNEHREAISAANRRCVAPENLTPIEVEVASVVAEQAPEISGADPEAEQYEEGYDPAANAGVFTPEDVAALEASAVERLVSFGRSEENATCVVENLVAIDAIDVLDSAAFGLGLDSREASAMGACLVFD